MEPNLYPEDPSRKQDGTSEPVEPTAYSNEEPTQEAIQEPIQEPIEAVVVPTTVIHADTEYPPGPSRGSRHRNETTFHITLKQLLSTMLTIALLAGAVGAGMVWWAVDPQSKALAAGTPIGVTTSTDNKMLLDSENNTIAVVDKVLPGVVQVQTDYQIQRNSRNPFSFGQSSIQRGNGSGFIYDNQGHIVTNHHVIDQATSIKVLLNNGKTYTATLVGSDALSDLAVLKINAPASELTPLVLASSDAVKVGQKAIAIGSPMATGNSDLGLDRSPTVTEGIVSAKDRSLPVSDDKSGNEYTIEGLIQTDAAINPGNSGGPLLNSSGEVIGVNTAIVPNAQGIGFSIPSSVVQKVVPQLLSGKTVGRPKLGVGVYALNSLKQSLGDQYKQLGLPVEQGALVTTVDAGGAADKAGLRASSKQVTIAGQQFPVGGDIITRVNGTIIVGDNLASVIRKFNPGDTVQVTVLRDGKEMNINVVLGSQ